jgi:benzoate-CoA ligase
VLGPPLARGLGDERALICDGRTITYDELNRLASRFGNACLAAGLERGDRVLMVVLDKPELVYAYLGTMKAGGVAVAFNVRAAAKDLAYVIRDSGCRLLLIDEMFLPVLEEARALLDALPRVVVTNAEVPGFETLEGFMAEASDDLAPAPTRSDEMAFWVYTSGTTGAPKGAVHRHGAVPTADRMMGEVLRVGPGDRLFCSSKLFFAFSLGHCLFASLRLGATTILYEGWPSPEAIGEIVERHHPTVVFSVPTFYRNLLRDGTAASEAFRSVRHYLSAGEKLPAELFERWRTMTGRPILEAIGATETVFLFLANRPADPCPGACGRPTPGTDVSLRDEDGTEIKEPGVPGVLWVRMGSLATGYWHLEDKTHEAFVNGWYRTGDMFALDAEGYYHHQGRADDMLKISGQWVSPAEIEEHVLRQEGVYDAAVVGVPNSDGLIRLSLFVVPADPGADRPALAEGIQEALKASLSIYKCPRRVFFLDDLPRTATGKVQRFHLRQLAADQVGSRP